MNSAAVSMIWMAMATASGIAAVREPEANSGGRSVASAATAAVVGGFAEPVALVL